MLECTVAKPGIYMLTWMCMVGGGGYIYYMTKSVGIAYSIPRGL